MMKKTPRHNARHISRALLMLLLLMMLAPQALANSFGTIRNPNGGTYVNVRSWPSYDAEIMTTLGVGTSVEITGSTGTWYSVWVNGVMGYVHSNFVTITGGGSGGGTGETATVRSGPLNIREAPSMRARVITQLPTGLRVTVTDNDGTWSRVQAADVTGYVMTNFLTFGGGTTTSKPPIDTENANATIRTTNGGNLNLRGYGSASAPVLDSFANGSRVRMLVQGNSWSRVVAGTQTGYMSTRFLVIDQSSGGSTAGYDAYVNNPDSRQVLNLRAEPSTDSRSLGQFYNGTYVKVLGVGTQWHRVTVNGVAGYMSAQFVQITSTGATPHKTIMGGTGGYVNLRSGPGYGYDVIRRVSNGSAASVVIPYPAWSQVIIQQGSSYETGYILNTFLK